MAFFSGLIPRYVLGTETDADSPDNETTYDGLRRMVEGLIIALYYTGVSGTVTGISSATLTDTGNFTTDQCNGWTLLITSGDAIGNDYTIDDTTTDTLVCTGDDLETDGVAIGDTYIVLYDLKVNLDGHDHDGYNSKTPVLADKSVHLGKIEAGTVMLPLLMTIEETEHTTNSTSYSTKATCYLYIPANAETVIGRARIHTDNGSYLAYAQIDIGSQTQETSTVATSYTWNDFAAVDVSGLSGWVGAYVKIKIQNVAANAYLQGYSFYYT